MKPSFTLKDTLERLKGSKHDPDEELDECGIEDSADARAFREHATKSKLQKVEKPSKP